MGLHCVCVCFAMLLFLAGLFSIIIRVESYKSHNYQTCTITGSATIIAIEDKYAKVDNVVADSYYSFKDNKIIDGYRFNGAFLLYYSETDYPDLSVGQKIEFSAKTYFNDVVTNSGEINAFLLYYNTNGYLYTSDLKATEIIENTDIFMPLRNRVKSIINNNMAEPMGSLAYSMMFGDKSELDDSVVESFNTTGISHLLAVSGLHVGFLMAILMFLLGLLKIKRKPRAIIISIILIIYAWICNFTPSVIRATLMCVVFLIASVRGKQYDLINSLSLCAILILSINPFALFSVGFQLSVVAVLFISMLAKSLSKVFSKFLPGRLGSALAVTLSAQIGTLPIIVNFYSDYSLLSVLANLLIVPLASIGFEIMFACFIIIAIFPMLGFILRIPEMVYFVVVEVSKFVSLSGFLIGLQINVVGYVTIFAISLLASHYVFVNKRIKSFCVLIGLIVLLLSLGVGLLK